MKSLIHISILLLILMAGCKTSQKAPNQKPKNNSSAPVAVAQTVASVVGIQGKFMAKDSNFVTVFMRVEMFKSGSSVSMAEFISRFTLNYVLYPDFASRERLAYGNLPLNNQSVSQVGFNVYMVRFDVKKPTNQSSAVMLAEFVEMGGTKKSLTELAIRFKNPKLSDRYTLFDKKGVQPLMRNYANVNDTLMIRNLAGSLKKMYLYYYDHSFDAAASPMNTGNRNTARTLNVDTVMQTMVGGPVVFRNEGLYYFVEDTTDAYGIGILVENKRFPKFTRPEELIQPVLYVSQNQEMAELNSAKQLKKALDRYWLTLLNGNTEAARRTIKSYYERVEEANRLFTTYKEGWKTDKGMIHIVMGPPDKVIKAKDREVWVYSQRANFSEINFTFNRRPNQFVEDHYDLQRYIEYQPIWYPMVESWRSGIVK